MSALFRLTKVLFTISTIFILGTARLFASGGDDYVSDQIAIKMNVGFVIDSVNAEYGTTVLRQLLSTGSYLLQTPLGADAESLASIIALEPGVFYCDADYLLSSPSPVQTSQPFVDGGTGGGVNFTAQPAVGQLSLTSAHTTSTASNVKVGVIDVGVNYAHPEFGGSVVSVYDYVESDSTANDESGGSASGHGTFVAGVIRLVAPDAQIRSYRVIDTSGHGDGFVVAEAILQAVSDGCKVINLSLVMNGKHGAVDDAMEYAVSHGVTVVAASGNDSVETLRFPARDSHSLSVAAIDSLNHLMSFSNYGDNLDVCAPGGHIYAPFLDTTYAWWDGTSFATPFVTGQVALLYELRPSATFEEIREAIRETAIDIDAFNNPTLHGKLGKGRIDPVGSLAFFGALSCGDSDASGAMNIGDVVYLVDYIFHSGPEPSKMSLADIDRNGGVDIGDVTYGISYIFAGGPPPNCGP